MLLNLFKWIDRQDLNSFYAKCKCLPVLLPVLGYLLPVFRIFDTEPWQRETTFSDCFDKWITLAETQKPLVYLSLLQKKRVTISNDSFCSGNWIHFSTLFRNGPKGRTAQRNSDCYAIWFFILFSRRCKHHLTPK